jgi:signal transduction histidine kinase/anti-sigma regulatory factor (Ser/Thr protein kinase)
MSSDSKKQTLLLKLDELLKSPTIDHGEVLRNATELAQLDPDTVRFSVNAGIIARLGEELVARQETALAELVKNAYDADATTVDVIFLNAGQSGGSLSIEDNGNGMNREDLIRGFMRISTPDKLLNPRSPLFNRQRAGRKGVGRFAAQRLGQHLRLTTQTQSGASALELELDWREYTPENDLITVGAKLREVPKVREKGTTLLITSLNDPWSDAKVERACRYVFDLLQPSHVGAESPHDSFSTSQTPSGGDETPSRNELKLPVESENPAVLSADPVADPGFVPRFLWEGQEGELNIVDENTMLLDHRVATISARIENDGQAVFRIDAPRLSLSEELHLLPPKISEGGVKQYMHLAGVRLSANYFILDKEYVPNLMLSRVKEYLSRHGGIRLYRNGFRVKPYGESPDDWLALDASSSRRSVLVPHQNKNFFGFVSINDVEGKRFNETLSREGLIENPAFDELRDFAYQVLVQAALRVGAVRGRKGKTNDPKPSTQERLRNLAKRVQDPAFSATSNSSTATEDKGASPNGEQSSKTSNDPVVEELNSIADAHETEREELLKELGMMRVLASLGVLIGQFTHEIRHDLVALASDVTSLARSQLPSNLQSIAERMRTNLDGLRTFAAYFDRTLSDNARRERLSLDLRVVLGRFQTAIKRRAEAQHLVIDCIPRGSDLTTRPMHPSEWTSVLLNLFTNAEKAIRRADVPGRILISTSRLNDSIVLDFSDNGIGIPPEHYDRVFDAFFTTSRQSDVGSAEFDQSQGMGLGLTIVRDIITSIEGKISVVNPPVGYATCFRIEIPAANERQSKS